MEKEQFELYEYARKRISQKKGLYYHFVLLILGSIFMFVANHFTAFGITANWAIWVIAAWCFLFALHFIKVFITDRFMNKNWEQDQIERLIILQEKKIALLQTKIEEDTASKTE